MWVQKSKSASMGSRVPEQTRHVWWYKPTLLPFFLRPRLDSMSKLFFSSYKKEYPGGHVWIAIISDDDRGIWLWWWPGGGANMGGLCKSSNMEWCVKIRVKDYKHSLSGLELRYTMCLDVSYYYCWLVLRSDRLEENYFTGLGWNGQTEEILLKCTNWIEADMSC